MIYFEKKSKYEIWIVYKYELLIFFLKNIIDNYLRI